jgi:hypothetical protein
MAALVKSGTFLLGKQTSDRLHFLIARHPDSEDSAAS